jgi:putative membrane protein
VFRPQGRPRAAHCFVLAIPVLLLLFPHNPLGASDLSYSYSGGGDVIQADPFAGAIPLDGRFSGELSGLDTDGKRIVVENEAFYPWLNEIYERLDEYLGYQISVTGFVLKDPEMFGPNEFVPARLGMSCCVADLVPYGMLCVYDKVGELPAGSWVTVEGVIEPGEYDGWIEPRIAVTAVTPADVVEGYIYPF